MDVELTVKFYDILEPKRFACFDENKAPLLYIMIGQHNAHNRIPIDEAQVIQSLMAESLQNPSCRANQDSLLVASLGGGVPTRTPPRSGCREERVRWRPSRTMPSGARTAKLRRS